MFSILEQIKFFLIPILLYHNLLVNSQTIKFDKSITPVKYANPDQKGYHYCTYWRMLDGTSLYATCDPFTFKRCGKNLEFEYKCCSGYDKVKQSSLSFGDRTKDQCAQQVSPFESCTTSIESQSDISSFASKLSSVSEINSKQPDQSYTIFAPKTKSSDQSVIATDHIVKGRFYVNELKTGMKLQTLNPKRELYVTRNSYGTISVDCVELNNADLDCKQGVIHSINQPLSNPPNVDRASILSLLESNPDTRLFAQDLPPKIREELRQADSGKRYTVTAPRAEAWEKVRRQYSGEKLQKIAAYHVLPDQKCSSTLTKTSETLKTLTEEKVEYICETDINGKERHYIKSVCGKKHEIITADMTSANGVAHVVNEALIPLSGMTFKQLQDDIECTKTLKIDEFVKTLKECDLLMEPGQKYAIVLPQDSSFTWWANYPQFQEEYKRYQVDKEYRCKVARYHIVKSDGRLDNIDRFSSNTMGHRTNNPKEPLYETTYFKKTPFGSQLNFHYSPINDMKSHETDDVTFYLTPRINVPPEQNLTDILENRPDTKIANNQTKVAGMNENFKKNAPKNLYLVTTDDGWKDPRASPTSKNPYKPELKIYKDKNLENYLMLQHIPLYLWGGDIGYFDKNTVHKFMSSAGVELIFWMDNDGVMRIGYDGLPRKEWPRVIKWNLPARDGIMWLLDGVLKCPEKLCPLLVEDIDYYDLYVMACQTAELPDEKDPKKLFETKPLDVASRHPNLCTVVLQASERTVTLIET